MEPGVGQALVLVTLPFIPLSYEGASQKPGSLDWISQSRGEPRSHPFQRLSHCLCHMLPLPKGGAGLPACLGQ